jgi:uncharacterized repeat protein (TIGR01451 family)
VFAVLWKRKEQTLVRLVHIFSSRTRRGSTAFLIFSLALTIAALALLLDVGVGAAPGRPAESAAPLAELHVCPSGCAYDDVQDAVDAATDGDVIKVAAGTYDEVSARPAPPGYEGGPAVITQVVYITKSLVIQGGYTPANWTTPDPEANATVLDAAGEGRVMFVAGDVTLTLAGLHLVNGQADGLGGHPWGGGSDTGGGLHVVTATVTIQDCWVHGNAAGFGGGIHLAFARGTIRDSEITANTAHWGGGVGLRMAGADIEGNLISGNHAVASVAVPCSGGGIDAASEGDASTPLVLIDGNTITGNQSDAVGGGIGIRSGQAATVSGNTITANSAITGGGLYLLENYVEVSGNTLSDNVATYGGGAAIDEGAAQLAGNTLTANTASDKGGGVYVRRSHYQGSSATLSGNTFTANEANDGGGLWIEDSAPLIQDSDFLENSAANGGAVAVMGCNATFRRNRFQDNTATFRGGGLDLGMYSGLMADNLILRNSSQDGGGASLFASGTWENNVLVANQASGSGSGLYLQGSVRPQMWHTTLANNTGGDGSAIYLTEHEWTGWDSHLLMTNTILAGHTTGIRVTAGSTVTLDGVLWYDTPTTIDQASGATVSLAHEYSDNPAFAADGYHLTARSAAIDRGIEAGLATDVDGEARPRGAAPDLGADETDPVADLSLAMDDDPDPVVAGEKLVYTLVASNDGPAQATGVIAADTLPGDAIFVSASAGCSHAAGTVTCNVGTLSAGARATRTVTVEPTAAGQLVNYAEVSGTTTDPRSGNNAAAAYTDVDPALLPNPLVLAVTPASGLDENVTPVTIEGANFQAGATASLGGTPLGSVEYVDDGRLLAVVPSGLVPGTYDLAVTNPDGKTGSLPEAFTVLTSDEPTVRRITPGQGPNDLPVTLSIEGGNFSPEVSATLRLAGDDVPLGGVVFMDSTRLRADVPISTTPGLYDLVVTNPDGKVAVHPDAYEALLPEDSEDLYAGETDLWLEPATLREGQAVTLGLTLRRQGGQADLNDIAVRFYLAGGTPSFEARAATVPPRSLVPVTVPWTPPPSKGTYLLYAQIDPGGEVPENDEDNNLISRTLTVLPRLSDAIAPTVDRLTIDDGSVRTDRTTVNLEIEASDNPGGRGVSSLLLVEHLYVQSEDAFVPVRLTGWVPYEEWRERTWRLTAEPGAHYVQVWAADAAGNVSAEPALALINYEPQERSVSYGEVHVYRYPLSPGSDLDTRIWTGDSYQYAVDLRIYDPDGAYVTGAWVTGEPPQDVAYASIDGTRAGVYQIELWGWGYAYIALWDLWLPLDSAYDLQVSWTSGGRGGTVEAVPAIMQDNPEPVIAPGDVPGPHLGLPSPLLVPLRAYVPAVLRAHSP